jgi:hypothetical protein
MERNHRKFDSVLTLSESRTLKENTRSMYKLRKLLKSIHPQHNFRPKFPHLVKLATKAREGSLKGEGIRRIRGGKQSLGYQLCLSYLNALGFIHYGVMPQSGG